MADLAAPSPADIQHVAGAPTQPGQGTEGSLVERALLVAVVLTMVTLPTLETIVRRFTGAGVPGAAVYTTHLTLWVGFLGALLATATNHHLALSTVEMLPKGRIQDLARSFGAAVTSLVCAILAYASLDLLLADRGRIDTLPLKVIPAWILRWAIPIVLAGVAAWRLRAFTKEKRASMIIGPVVLLGAAAFSRYVAADLLSTPPGGLPEWWFEIIMPVGFAVMSFRGAKAAPGRGGRWFAWALALAVVPFAISRFADLGGHAFLPAPDGPTLLHGHTALLGWPGSILLFGSFLLGAPVFVVMAGFALLLFFLAGTPVASVPGETFRLVVSPTLPAIPLLTVAGYILAEGGASKRLVRAAQSLFGWMPGGLAVVAAFVCALFTTFTGASGVTILALGGIIFPALVSEGYPEGFSLGLVTASGSLGLLFPPSLPVILYGVVAGVAIDRLYIGGVVPGLLMVVLVAIYGIIVGIRSKAPRPKFNASEAGKAVWGAKWDLGLPLLIVVSVASGFATIVESAALGAAYAILVELVVQREIHPTRDLPRVLVHASTLVGSVVILLGVALGMTSYLVDAEIPTALLTWVQAHIHSQWVFLLALNVLLLVLGSVLEIYSAIVVLAPLVAPLGVAFGVEPVHLGVVFLANLELGFLFPPMGLNLFLSASRFQKPLPLLYRKAFPFLLIMTAGVLLITYVPAITTGVVALIKGGP
ncbi:MAG TPA: TRAP transporter large permease subunit [Myxococcales bacterium]|nr:TRAP transporter large permease subunit [Myxococcales bacterium]